MKVELKSSFHQAYDSAQLRAGCFRFSESTACLDLKVQDGMRICYVCVSRDGAPLTDQTLVGYGPTQPPHLEQPRFPILPA